MPGWWALGVVRSVTCCRVLENVSFAFQVARGQGLAAPGPGKVVTWGQEGQERGSPQDAGRSEARVPLAQLKSSFIRQFPKLRLFTRKSHPQGVGGTKVGGCPSLLSVLVLPKCPPSSTVSPSLLSVPTPSQIPHSSPAVCILSKCPCPSSVSSSFPSILIPTILVQPRRCCPPQVSLSFPRVVEPLTIPIPADHSHSFQLSLCFLIVHVLPQHPCPTLIILVSPKCPHPSQAT